VLVKCFKMKVVFHCRTLNDIFNCNDIGIAIYVFPLVSLCFFTLLLVTDLTDSTWPAVFSLVKLKFTCMQG